MLFGHGDDYHNATHEIKVNFSSNVWHGANLQPLRAHLNDHFACITRYPEPDAGSLKRLIAQDSDVAEENLIVTNGSITAFYLLAQAWRGAHSLIRVPSFAEYEDACVLYDHRVTYAPTTLPLAELPLAGQDFCWICNPNNPDGQLADRPTLLSLFEAHPETLFIVDQAYADFTTRELLKPSDIHTHPNLILIQSISKAYDVPGLRIGYLVASRQVVEHVMPYVIPWSVNALAIEAGKYIWTHPEAFNLPIREWLQQTNAFIDRLNTLSRIEALPTSTTFFLVRLLHGQAAALKTYLLEQEGFLIRDASNFRGLDDTYFRLSTQKPAENLRLIEAIKKFVHTFPSIQD